jgi:Helicase associated domain
MSEKIELIGGDLIDLDTLKAEIFAEIVSRIGSTWDEWYGRLLSFKDREGHCRVSYNHKENGVKLGVWVSEQRAFGSKLSTERKRRLDSLGFVWDLLEVKWDEGFNYLKLYYAREGHCRVAFDHIEGSYRLGWWVNTQRGSRNKLPKERRDLLSNLNFIWDARSPKWNEGFSALKLFSRREGHCLVPAVHNENGFSLGRWVNGQRAGQKSLSNARRQLLTEIGFVWDARAAKWDEVFAALKAFSQREGHCRVPQAHKEGGFKLHIWISTQRTKQKSLSKERWERLDEIGFEWGNLADKRWQQGWNYLERYYGREKHSRVPPDHKESGYNLGPWVFNQRQRGAKMPSGRRAQLDALEFVWSPFDVAWDRGYYYLKLYYKRENHSRVPIDHREDGYTLGSWARNQRAKRETMTDARRRKLNALNFVWDVRQRRR